jgi:hypothetical protein
MDLTVTSGNSTPILADVTVTHPITSQTASITPAMMQPLYFAKHREEGKIRKYGQRANQMQHHFIPLVLETFGAFGPKFSAFLKSLAHRASQGLAVHNRAQIIRYWRMKISACLQRANARLIISKANRIRCRTRLGSVPSTPVQHMDFDIR